MSSIALICGWLAAALLTYMAFLFWRDPDDGLKQTTHRIENLPLVMANRYTAFAILGVAIVISGNLALLAVFFAVCALMGLADGKNYKDAGHPHIKHTASGVLSIIALCVTLAAMGS